MTALRTPWEPHSWRAFPIQQHPTYTDAGALSRVEQQLRNLPPLVFAGEIMRLRKSLARAESGEAFILQGGDCAESFDEFSADITREFLRVLLQCAIVLTFRSGKHVIKIGRIAGQFAKPRSRDTETINGETLPSYRGDSINAAAFDALARTPDPQRMLLAYNQSAATLNLLRAFANGGFASLHHVHKWIVDFVANSPRADDFAQIAQQTAQTLRFMNAIGLDPEHIRQLNEVNVYTSHEALLLYYEQALTRKDATTGAWVNGAAHMLWVGDRTRQGDGAHIEYLRGIANPIGIKCGPTAEPADIIDIITALNPDNEPGKIVLIVRMGATKIADKLPSFVRALEDSQRRFSWSCDPMHGNTYSADSGYKTRTFSDILTETELFFAILQQERAIAGGIHLEMTGKNVTECVGGANPVHEDDLSKRYHTFCDPRLNAEQSLELAFLLAERIDPDRSV